MSTPTSIQWTDAVENIIVVEGGGWWCRMISEGCGHCYAAEINQNTFFGGNKLPYSGDPPKLKLRTDIMEAWGRQRIPRKHFVCSMTDLFGEWVPYEMIHAALCMMHLAPLQTFQLLTKRPENMAKMIERWLLDHRMEWLPRNIWVGTSVETQRRAAERIPVMLTIPARIRFLSVEPLLEEVDLTPFLGETGVDGARIHWVIAGGESGKDARMCHVDWIHRIVRTCTQTATACFVKQLGSDPRQDISDVLPEADITDPELDAADIGAWEHHRHNAGIRLKDKKGGSPAEWPEFLQCLNVREFPVGS
jgi:protein gp37